MANEEVFDKLLARLEPDLPDSARRYKQFRLKLTKFFQWKHCADAESLADETVARTIKNILNGLEIETDNPYIYIFTIAKNVYREYVRREIKYRDLLSDITEQSGQPEEVEGCWAECLQALSREKLMLLQIYFLGDKNGIQLAEEMNMKVNALRLKIFRLKKELEACHEKCLRNLSES